MRTILAGPIENVATDGTVLRCADHLDRSTTDEIVAALRHQGIPLKAVAAAHVEDGAITFSSGRYDEQNGEIVLTPIEPEQDRRARERAADEEWKRNEAAMRAERVAPIAADPNIERVLRRLIRVCRLLRTTFDGDMCVDGTRLSVDIDGERAEWRLPYMFDDDPWVPPDGIVWVES